MQGVSFSFLTSLIAMTNTSCKFVLLVAALTFLVYDALLSFSDEVDYIWRRVTINPFPSNMI